MSSKNTLGLRLAVMAALVFVVPAWAGTIFVSTSGKDAGTGQSWAAAKRTVQAGLDTAIAGDQVWVATGTYVENITLKDGVALYGGLAGNEDPATFDLADRDFQAHETTLDGNQNGSVVTSPEGATQTTRIDGFAIRGGTNRGVFCLQASPTIANNTITGNAGGGIHCSQSSAVIINNTISGNIATMNGGGIFSTDGSPVIAGTTIADNTSTGSGWYGGGGICCWYGSSAIIACNVIESNRAAKGGGILCLKSAPVIANNTIAANTATDSDGGIYCQDASPAIANSIIAFNSSGIGVSGSSTPTLRYNCVYGNMAHDYRGLTSPVGTDGNISADPKFASLVHGDLHLKPGSPCIDVGDDAIVQPGWTDIDGQARIHGTRVDIGADEFDGTVWQPGPRVIVRVSPEGDDANDGSSWEGAKRTVQAGIDAVAGRYGDVWVKAGVYRERIVLRSAVSVVGGFAGNEDETGDRDCRANETVLDGEQMGSVVTADGVLAGAISGFTITNGNAAEGGGVCCRDSALAIADNKILKNIASDGGGVYCRYSAAAISRNAVSDNSAEDGGGIYLSYCRAEVDSNVITVNRASSMGGGLNAHYGFATLINNTIAYNSTSSGVYGGGVASYSVMTITNTIVAFNSSGLYLSGSPLTQRHSCVYGNMAYDYSGFIDPVGTDGNISVDPKFVSPAYGNWHIQPQSPCVDAGDDAMAEPGTLDIDGEERNQGGSVDIGADESDGTVWQAGPQVIVRVSSDGDDANDGSSWQQAKRTIQAGIDSVADRYGDVWVKAGVYRERIALRSAASVFGGFDGTEDHKSDRNLRASVTVLDGQAGGSVVTASNVLVARIDSFTITNGNATSGGGIYCSSSSPVIANNIIKGNTAANWGGGVCCRSASPRIVGSLIAGNTANEGSGVFCIYLAASRTAIMNSTIAGNSATVGGSVEANDRASLVVENSIIAFNSSGVLKVNNKTMTLRNNCVHGNIAYNYSGIADPTGIEGNISGDPGFASRYGNYRLLPGSLCIDGWDDAPRPTDVEVDLDGLARIADGNGDGVAVVDMGAHEYAGFPILVGLISRRQHGAAGVFDIDLPLDGQAFAWGESRQGGVTELVIVFSEPVFAAGETPGGPEVMLSTGAVEGMTLEGDRLTLQVSGIDGPACLTVTVAGLANANGQPLLGGQASFRVLPGDVNADGAVSILDLVQVRNELNRPVTADSFRADVNADGMVNIFDLVTVRNALNTTVSCP